MFATELFWGLEEKLFGREYVLGTTAIYDVAKNWTEDNEVICFREMPLGWGEWLSYKVKSIFGHTSIYDSIPAYYEADGIKVYCLKYIKYLHRGIIGKFFYKRFATKINNKLKAINWEPDVIVAHMPTMNAMFYIGMIEGNATKIAVLHSGDLVQLFDGEKIVKRKAALLEANFDRIFSRSQVIYNRAQAIGLSNLTSDIVSSAIPMYGRSERDWGNLKERKINILYAGSLIERKGVQQILKAVAQLVDKYTIELPIIGSGNYEKKLKQLVQILQIEDHVEFMGKKSRETVYDYMKKADIFITPSYQETLGLVYLEAMLAGCITIGSRGEGIDGIIIDGENGYLVDPYSLEEITECMEKVINMSQNELEQVSNKAVRTAMFYNEENISDHYLKLIEKTVSESGKF